MWDVVSAFDGSDRPADKGRKGEREKGQAVQVIRENCFIDCRSALL